VTHAELAHVVRSGTVESVHLGSLVALGADGRPAVVLGDVERPIMPRSSNKPLQAAGMLHAGLDLDGQLLALAAASHSGERYHLDGVRRMLAPAALPLEALANAPDLPLDEAERLDWVRAGRPASSLAQNCSGKHAAMLRTCVAAGWSTEGYLRPDHPLQRSLRGAVSRLAGEDAPVVAVDGCGAPVFALSLLGLARAFSALATAAPGTPERRVAAAVSAHPEWLGGTGRPITQLLRGRPGLVAKEGAEGVFAAALPDGRAVAFKISDGSARPVFAVAAAALRRLGSQAVDGAEPAVEPVLGGGAPVGEIRAVGLDVGPDVGPDESRPVSAATM